MFCSICSRLAFHVLNRSCLRCQGAINNNLSVICDSCSSKNKQCAICLKKIVEANKRVKGCGCSGR